MLEREELLGQAARMKLANQAAMKGIDRLHKENKKLALAFNEGPLRVANNRAMKWRLLAEYYAKKLGAHAGFDYREEVWDTKE